VFLPVAWAAVAGLLAVGALALTVANLGTEAPSGLHARPADLLVTVALLTFALVGAVVASRRPGTRSVGC
jgi:hypothetical protein